MDWLLWFLLFFILTWIVVARSARIYFRRGLLPEDRWMGTIPFPIWFYALIMIFSYFAAYMLANVAGLLGMVIQMQGLQ